jgi:hypothetical protein
MSVFLLLKAPEWRGAWVVDIVDSGAAPDTLAYRLMLLPVSCRL